MAAPVGDKDNCIQKYTTNLNQLLLNSKYILTGRLGEITEVIYTLLRIKKNNPLLIGYPGVGKTALVHELVRLINHKKLPKDLNNKIIYQLDINALQAGCSQYGEIEKRVTALMKMFAKSTNHILFIDEIHQSMIAGSTNSIGDIIKPYSSIIIGATTIDEYRKHIEGDGAFCRRFNTIYLAEPDLNETIHITRGAKANIELYFNVKIADRAIYLAAKIGKRFFIDKYNPDLTLELLEDAACAIGCSKQIQPYAIVKAQEEIERLCLLLESKKIEKLPHKDLSHKIYELKHAHTAKKNQWIAEIETISQILAIKAMINKISSDAEQKKLIGDFEEAGKLLYLNKPKLEKKLEELEQHFVPEYIGCSVEPDDILKTISRRLGIAVDRITHDHNTASALNQFLKKYILSQDNAIDAITNSLKISFSWFRRFDKPLSILFFAGKTGTGKTETARQIAHFLSNMENFTIIDMAKYTTVESISGLIGSQKGYVGYGERGELTGAVQQKRLDQVIVLDEIEKAHTGVFNLLLSIFDRGVIHDSLNRVANFKETIFILTSNIQLTPTNIPDDGNTTHVEVKTKLDKYFSLEFINRLDEIIVFKSFNSRDLEKIIMICSQSAFKNFEEQFGINVKIDSTVVKYITSKINKAYGAREVSRWINQLVVSPLIDFIYIDQEINIAEIGTILITYVDKKIKITSNKIKNT